MGSTQEGQTEELDIMIHPRLRPSQTILHCLAIGAFASLQGVHGECLIRAFSIAQGLTGIGRTD